MLLISARLMNSARVPKLRSDDAELTLFLAAQKLGVPPPSMISGINYLLNE